MKISNSQSSREVANLNESILQGKQDSNFIWKRIHFDSRLTHSQTDSRDKNRLMNSTRIQIQSRRTTRNQSRKTAAKRASRVTKTLRASKQSRKTRRKDREKGSTQLWRRRRPESTSDARRCSDPSSPSWSLSSKTDFRALSRAKIKPSNCSTNSRSTEDSSKLTKALWSCTSLLQAKLSKQSSKIPCWSKRWIISYFYRSSIGKQLNLTKSQIKKEIKVNNI